MVLLTVSVKVRRGDSEWNILRKAIEREHLTPSNRDINTLVDLTAKWNSNRNSNPDQIIMGQELSIPSPYVIRNVAKADQKEIVDDMNTLNSLPNVPKREVIRKESKLLQRMTSFLKSHRSRNYIAR